MGRANDSRWLVFSKRSSEGGERVVAAKPSVPHRKGAVFEVSIRPLRGDERRVLCVTFFLFSPSYTHTYTLTPPSSLIVMFKARFLCRISTFMWL